MYGRNIIELAVADTSPPSAVALPTTVITPLASEIPLTTILVDEIAQP